MIQRTGAVYDQEPARPVVTLPQQGAAAGAPAGTPGYTAFQGNPLWADIGGLNVPTFSQSDFAWTPNESYDPTATQYERYLNNVGDSEHWDWRQNPNYIQGQWDMTPEAMARLVAGGWDPKNQNNIGFNRAFQGGEPVAGGGIGIGANDPNTNWQDMISSALYKNSETTANTYNYVYDPASGRMVPRAGQGVNWLTNVTGPQREFLAAAGLMVGGAIAAPYLAGAAGGGAAGGTGLAAGEGSMIGPGLTSVADLGAGAGAGVGGAAGAGSGLELGGGIPSISGVSGTIPEIGSYGSLPTAYGGVGNGIDWSSLLKDTGKDLLKQALKSYVSGQAQGGVFGGGAGGYSGGGGSRVGEAVPTPGVPGSWKPNVMPLGGLIPPGATNPVSDAAEALATTLTKRRGLYG